MKYTTREKQGILEEWFETDNVIIKPLTGLPRYNSPVDNYVEENNKMVFELLELEGSDCIRFAMGRPNDCTCRSGVLDLEDVLNLHKLINEYLEKKELEGIN